MNQAARAALVAAGFLLSGCLGSASKDAGPSPARLIAPAPGPFERAAWTPAVETYWFNGSFAAAVEPGAYALKRHVENHVQVPKNAQAVEVELRWPPGPADLDLVVVSPRWQRACGDGAAATVACAAGMVLKEGGEGLWANYDGVPGAPDGPARLRLDGRSVAAGNDCPEPRCPWTFAAYVDGGSAEAVFQMSVIIRSG